MHWENTSKGYVNRKQWIDRVQLWQDSGRAFRIQFQVLLSCRTTLNFLSIPMWSTARSERWRNLPELFYWFMANPECNWLCVIMYSVLCWDWCGSVGWVLSHTPRGHQLDSRLEHIHGLWTRFQEGCTRDVCLSLSPTSPSLTLSL